MPIIKQLLYQTDKSSHWRCSIKNAICKNFAIFTVKHLCWSLGQGSKKVAGHKICNLIKKTLQHKMFFCKYCKISNNTCFEEHLRMAASENNIKKSFLGKVTGHNDHYMIIWVIKDQRLAVIDRWPALICSAAWTTFFQLIGVTFFSEWYFIIKKHFH